MNLKLPIALAAITLCFSVNNITKAQGLVNDKAVIKEWKAKLKSTDPLAFKAIVEERDQLKQMIPAKEAEAAAKTREADSLRTSINKYVSENNDLNGRLKSTQDQLIEAQTKITKMAAAPAPMPTAASAKKAAKPAKGSSQVPAEESAEPSTTGIVYKVQIGAFKNKDLTKYFKNHKNFSGEIDADGTKKYTLGLFNEYWEADNFKKYMREMGVKDAWIVAYKDGSRIAIKDALEGTVK